MITAPTTPPADGAPLPTPPSTTDIVNFDSRGDAYFLAEQAFQTAMNLLKANVYTNTTATYQNTLQTAIDAASTAANAALAASYAGAVTWVSGTTYAQYTVVSSPANGRLYKKQTTTAGGAVDPSANGTDWSPVAVAAPSLLVTALVQQAISGGAYALTNSTAQSAATNLALYSSQADNAAWTKASATVTADATMAPDGSTTGDKIVEAAATAVHSLAQTVTAAANVAYTYSVYVKAAGRTSIALALDRDAGMVDYCRAVYNLTTGAVTAATNAGTGSGAAGTATFLGNGWWLCTLTGTPSTTAGTQVRGTTFLVDQNAYAGDGVSGVYVAEAQLETGVAATSRIATTSASAARAASVVAPQRVVLPLAPAADAWVRVYVGNGITTNVIDPNGSTITGSSGVLTGAMQLDNAGISYTLQYINSSWRFNL